MNRPRSVHSLEHKDKLQRAGLAQSRRAVNALVVVGEGEAVSIALRRLRRQMDDTGVSRLLKRKSRLFSFESPSQRRRAKRRIAVARLKKAEVVHVARELRRDPDGRRPVRPQPREAIVAVRLAVGAMAGDEVTQVGQQAQHEPSVDPT